MQVLCYHLFNNQISRTVGIDVWDKALQAALNDMGIAIFNHWLSQASSEEAKVLGLISRFDTEVSAKEIQGMAKVGEVKISPQSIAKYLQRLTEKRLLNKSGRGLYEIPDRMFRAYIRIRRQQAGLHENDKNDVSRFPLSELS